MFNFLRALERGQTNSARHCQQKRPRYIPRLECLEDRLLPSLSVSGDNGFDFAYRVGKVQVDQLQLAVGNNSSVPVYLQAASGPLLGDLLAVAPVSPVYHIQGHLAGHGVTLKAGLELPADLLDGILSVDVFRVVQRHDPRPTVFTTVFVFSANQDGSGERTEATPSWTVAFFTPPVRHPVHHHQVRLTVGMFF